MIKGRSELSRLYKIDVVSKGRNIMSGSSSDLDLILHFVNKNLDPTGVPDVKKYTMKADAISKAFLAKL